MEHCETESLSKLKGDFENIDKLISKIENPPQFVLDKLFISKLVIKITNLELDKKEYIKFIFDTTILLSKDDRLCKENIKEYKIMLKLIKNICDPFFFKLQELDNLFEKKLKLLEISGEELPKEKDFKDAISALEELIKNYELKN
jgi:hypothetical protein